jgi:hypothetical protein
MTPISNLTDWSVNCNDIWVGLNSPTLILSKIDLGMRLTLAPKLHNARLNCTFPMEQGIANFPGSFNFLGKLANETTCISSDLRLFEIIYLKNWRKWAFE